MSSFEAGHIFESRYRIEGVLGIGGFSVVYDATDLDYDERVAIKVVEPEGTRYTGPTRARFEREIAAVADLEDPHTIQVYEFGTTADGLMYAVFEYVPGRDLSEVLLERGSLRPSVVERILRQLLSSLGEAHSVGLLHRDLKPENVRVFERDGDPWTVKLLDFGIARPVGAQDASVTATGELVGTPRYMSPEQLTDMDLTAASDIYSLGILAFELLAGRDALHGNSWMDQLDRLRSGHLFSVDEVEGSENLERVIRGMTAFDLEDRFQSAEDVLAVLDAAESADDSEPDTPEAEESIATLVEESPDFREITEPEFLRPAETELVTSSEAAPALKPERIVVVAAVFVLVALSGWALLSLLTRSTDEPQPKQPSVRSLPPGFLAQGADGPPAPTPPVLTETEPAEPSPNAARGLDGCGREPPFRGRDFMRSRHELSRDPWDTYIPESYDPDRRHPLVMLIHDRGQAPGPWMTASGFQELAEKQQFVVVAPTDQMIGSWLDASDVAKLFEIYDETATELCIDRSRIFLVAQGGGGEVAVPLTCARWVTAVATNSFRREREFRCETPRPMMTLSPLRSQHEPVDGGTNCKGSRQLSLENVESMWQKRNRCEGEPHTTFEHEGSRCQTWECKTPFVSCRIDGGRGWPGAPIRKTNNIDCEGPPVDFPTAERMWQFFSSLPVADDSPP